MAQIKDWSSLAAPDPEWTKFVDDSLGGEQPDVGKAPSIAHLRETALQAAAAAAASGVVAPVIAGVLERDHKVAMRDGAEILCRVYWPESPRAAASPLLVHFHGGGWCLGDLETDDALCRAITSELGVTCVNVDYRLAPEHPFPVAVHDSYDATKWAAANASSLGADPCKGFIVCGASAGGNLAAVVAHLARDDRLSPPLTGALHMIPAVVAPSAVPDKYKAELISYEQNKAGPILSSMAMTLFYDNYVPDVADRSDPLVSPLLWESGHKDLPASAFQICGADPLRDEAFVYERSLREVGVETKTEVYPGLPHGFRVFAPNLNASRKYIDDSVSLTKWLLERN